MSRHPAAKFANKYTRKLHRWGAILIALPLAIVVGSGILLLLKKESAWIQPPTRSGTPGDLTLSFDEILAVARTIDRAGVESWDDVDRLDVRPGKGIVKVRTTSQWEIQIDTGADTPPDDRIVQVAYRRSDLIESIHDGSFFHDAAKLWIFLPNAIVLALLWLTGIYLWILPFWARRQGRKKREALRS